MNDAAEISFDFIIDEQLRESLESDYRELLACLSSRAWKATHVLSGSIVEALLVDYLLGAGYDAEDPLKMTLEKLVQAAQAAGVLSQKAADLSSVIRGYRNLIHPGRVKRLDEVVNEEGAQIAAVLVSLIVREVSAKQAQEYGLTAEQLLTKFEDDPSALAISDHLIGEARPQELERLLVSILPERFFVLFELSELDDISDDGVLTRLSRLYYDAYEAAPTEIQQKVAKHYVAVLREQSGRRVEIYEGYLFRGYFLAHLTDAERKLVKDHFFSRLEGQPPKSLIEATEGFSEYLRPGEVNPFVDAFIRLISYTANPSLAETATRTLVAEFHDSLPVKLEARVIARLDNWIDFHKERGRSEAASRVEQIRVALSPSDDDIPF